MKNLPLPDIKVDRFRQSLRRDLQRQFSKHGSSGYKWAFVTACFLTGILASMVTAFIARPAIPANLHAILVAAPEDAREARATLVAGEMAERRGIPLSRTRKGFELLQDRFLPIEADHRFLSDWYQNKYPTQPFEVKAVEDEMIYAARRFKLRGGKTIVVYTELSEAPAYLENSY